MTGKASTAKALTSQTSAKYEPSVHNGLWNIRNCMKFSVIILILHLIAAPTILISGIYNITNHISPNPSESTYVIAAGATFFAGALGILIAFMNFGCLYNKNKADMYLSAPLSMKQRFFSDYLSGLASYIIPFIAAQIPTLILFAVGHFGFDGKEFTYYIEGTEGKITEYHYVSDFFGKAFPYYGRFAVGGIIAMIMLFTLTVLILTCCGTLFDGIVHTVLINVFAFLAPYYSFNFLYQNDHSYMADLNKLYFHILAFTSPAGAVVTLVTGLFNNLTMYRTVPLWSWTVGVIANIAINFAAAYFLYKKRRAEQLSKPIVFRWIYGLMMTLALCFAIAVTLNQKNTEDIKFDKYSFTVLICSLLVYLVCEIVSNRGVKKLWKGAVRFAVSFAVLTGCFLIVSGTRFFGIEYYVPSVDEVEKIYLGYPGIYRNDEYTSFSYYSGDGSDGLVTVIEDRNNIESIVAAQNSIVSALKKAVENGGAYNWDSWYYENGEAFDDCELSVCCELKNGKRVTRRYSFVTPQAAQFLSEIDISDEYKKQYADKIRRYFKPYNELLESIRKNAEYFGASDDPTETEIMLSISSPYSLAYNNDSKKIPMSESFYNELRDAIANDIMNRTASEYFQPCSERKYTISVRDVLGTFNINSNYSETMKVLASYNCFEGLGVENDDILDESIKIPERLIRIQKGSLDYRDDASWLSYCEKNGLSNSEYIKSFDITNNSRYVVHYSDDLRKLFEVMQYRYVTDELSYVIYVNNRHFVIPPEYSDVAERVYDSAEKLSDYPDSTGLYYGLGAVKETVSSQLLQ